MILGKTNLSEWANFRSTHSPAAGAAAAGRPTIPTRSIATPAGSSSGSGAAIAARFAAVAVGTETDGSVVCPAAINGLVGHQADGRPGESHGDRADLRTAKNRGADGAHGRRCGGAAERARRPRYRRCGDRRRQGAAASDYVAALSGEALKGVRIGVARNLAGFHEGVDAIFEAALAQLRAAGAELVDPADLRIDAKASADEFTVLLYEFKDGMNRYLKTRVGGPQSLAELITFNEAHRDQEMPYFGQEIFQQAQAKGDLREREYRHARDFAQRAAGRNGIDAVLKKYRLSAIVAPTAGPAWSIDLVNGDHFVGGESTSAAAIAGYPHITVPAGFLHGLPVGVSFIGAAWSEATLLGVANAFEQASHARRPRGSQAGRLTATSTDRRAAAAATRNAPPAPRRA